MPANPTEYTPAPTAPFMEGGKMAKKVVPKAGTPGSDTTPAPEKK
jgi:hypothetical protein